MIIYSPNVASYPKWVKFIRSGPNDTVENLRRGQFRLKHNGEEQLQIWRRLIPQKMIISQIDTKQNCEKLRQLVEKMMVYHMERDVSD